VIYNFNAGPSILPKQVFEQCAQAVVDYNGTGLSILEIGHRTPIFEEILHNAQQMMKELMQLNDNYEVLFLHGGATQQFMQVPLNLLDSKETAAYSDTGVWASKAIKEAQQFGKVVVACSSKDKNYSYLPNDFAVPNDAKYFHITTNNTIYGTQWQKLPLVSNSMVADMSSDILSRQINFNAFDVIYAGAQKNIGAAGVTIVVINKNVLGKVKRQIPTILDYKNHIEAGSMLNTPPVFAVYTCMLTLQWLKENGAVPAIEVLNNEKAALLYNEIDRNPLFEGIVNKEDRSKMNVCFTATDAATEERFLQYAKAQGIVGIKGHRLSGAFRASLYNAMPLTSVQVLVDVMQQFEKNN
jgi:phosphoserine aminotransferase